VNRPSRAAAAQQGKPATFNLFSGRALGDISNVLSEASSFLSSKGKHAASVGAGVAGESLFTVGGVWQAATAGKSFVSLYNSASSPTKQKELLAQAVDFMKGVSNTISGGTGIAALTPNASAALGKASSVTWALSEGTNAIMQAQQALTQEKPLSKEQLVNIGQVIGSTMKFAGIVASLAGAPGNGPIIAQVLGSGASISSGVLNLNSKGYSLSATVSHYANQLKSMAGLGNTPPNAEPAEGEINPETYEMT